MAFAPAGLVNMPKRWLSRNGRHNNTPTISSPKPPLFHNNQDFDFAFTDLHSLRAADVTSLSALPSAPLDDVRPTTSAGLNGRPKKVLRVDVLSNRPKTSDGPSSPPLPLAEPGRHRSQSEEDLIGVAIGSPGHPPMAFCNNSGEISPRREEHIFGMQGPFPEQSRLQPVTWKKLGNLFRARQGSMKGKHPEEFERSYAPTPRQHWYKPRSHTPDPIRVPPTIRIDREHPEKLHEGSEPKTILDLEPSPPPALTPTDDTSASLVHPRREASLPRLDTKNTGSRALPSKNSSSSLLARRSRTLENLKSQTFLRVSSDESEASPGPRSAERPHSARRQTTPTMSNPPPIAGLVRGGTPSPAVSKYSLFPPAPAGKIVIRSPTGARLERANTSPARLSPAQQQFPAGECPAQLRRGAKAHQDVKTMEVLSSPEEHTASTHRTDRDPWSAGHSPNSSKSSNTTAEEIFFDIKSFRDSRGVDQDDQYVMTRPDSVQVSLARTRSKLNAASRTGKEDEDETEAETETVRESQADKASTTANSTPNPNENRFSVSTAIFDETIAAVEAMSLPASMREKASAVAAAIPDAKLAQPQTPSSASHYTQPGSVTAARAKISTPPKQDLTIKLLPPDPGMPKSRSTSNLRNEVMGRATPSPIPEEPVVRPSTSSLSPGKKTAGASRTPSPHPILAAAEQSIAAAHAVIEALEKDQPVSWSEQKRVSPTLGPAEASASISRTASPATLRTASPATVALQRPPLSATSNVSKQSQKPPLSATSTYSQPSPLSAALQGPAARIKELDRPIEESPTIPQSPGPGKHNPNRATIKERPPPVPEKDAKFIPISKFASKSTVEKVERAGVTPARITRSATDSSLSSPLSLQGRMTGYRTASGSSEIGRRPLRSETMPSSNSPMLSQAVYRATPKLGQTQHKESPQLRDGITVVQANPAAEVSVARTVSLARKQSAKVLVPGPKLQARRLEEETKRKETERTATPTGLGLVMDETERAPTHQKQSSISSSEKERRGPLNSNPSTSEYVLESAEERAERERAQKAAIVEAAKARARARRAESQSREQREQAEKDQERIAGYRESQGDEERARWEILEKRAMSPLLVEGHRGHKPGVSVNIVLESA